MHATSLARALAALVDARTATGLQRDALAERFEHAVRKLDDADREYRTAMEGTLSPQHARELLAAMQSFRRDVAQVREQARATAPYGDFDPLDTYVPPFGGTHADAVRAANVGDRARQAVADARARANTQIASMLSPQELERLIDAKERRADAFEEAIREAAPREVTGHLLVQLVMLAEGWY